MKHEEIETEKKLIKIDIGWQISLLKNLNLNFVCYVRHLVIGFSFRPIPLELVMA